MSLVIDASLTLSWYFDDESTEIGDTVMEQVARDGAVVPILWRYEVANAFLKAIRRKRVDAAYRDASLAELRLLPIIVDTSGEEVTWTTTLGISDRFGLSIYDAAYVELAHRRAMALATGDRAMSRAAQALSISVIS